MTTATVCFFCPRPTNVKCCSCMLLVLSLSLSLSLSLLFLWGINHRKGQSAPAYGMSLVTPPVSAAERAQQHLATRDEHMVAWCLQQLSSGQQQQSLLLLQHDLRVAATPADNSGLAGFVEFYSGHKRCDLLLSPTIGGTQPIEGQLSYRVAT